MNRTIIIDNETQSISLLSNLLERHCSESVHLHGCFTSFEDGLTAIRQIKPQLVFLNTDIKDTRGFDLLKHLQEKKFEFIVTSDSDRHALEALRHSALDYLLKPIDPDGLISAVRKLNAKKQPELNSKKIDSLAGNIEQLKQYTPLKKIMVPTSSGFELIPVIDILRCQSDINYTTIHMKEKHKLVVAKTLKEFEEMLEGYNFFRVHNSHFVNLAYIKSYQKGKGGSVLMIDGTTIEVSTRRKDDFLKRMEQL